MKICICGGGSLGHVCAGVFASAGHEVNILSGHPSRWHRNITIYDPNNKEYSGALANVSADPNDVIPEMDIVLLCLPGYLIKDTLSKIKPYLSNKTAIGSIVSSTGFFFFAHDILPNKTLFGFQRVPYIARVKEYGKSAYLLGYKDQLKIAIENCFEKEVLRTNIEKLFNTPTVLLESFYEAALTNSNPILHTSRLYSLWNKEEIKPIKDPILFYNDWTDEASQLLISMDSEFMQLINSLGVRRGAIQPLLEYYESKDAKSLTQKIKSIVAFKTIKAPMVETENGWLPDFNSRYFTEDFPFGLHFIKKLSEKNNIETPIIDQVYNWGMSKIKKID